MASPCENINKMLAIGLGTVSFSKTLYFLKSFS